MITLPIPKADQSTGVIDWTGFDAAIKKLLANWPDAQGFISEYLVLEGDKIKQGDIKLITKDLQLITDIYTKAQANSWQPGERGKYIADVLCASADALVSTLQGIDPAIAAQIAAFIPFLLGSGAVV